MILYPEIYVQGKLSSDKIWIKKALQVPVWGGFKGALKYGTKQFYKEKDT